MNRKILISGLSIVASLTLAGGATFAFFQSIATSSANTFAAGTLNLTIDDPTNLTPAPTQTGSFVVSDMIPGATPTPGWFSLHNGGTIDMAKVKVKFDTTGGSTPNLADVIDIPSVSFGSENTCSGAENIAPTIAAQLIITPPLTFANLNGKTYDALPGIPSGSDRFMCFSYNMDSGASNSYQGASTTQSFSFEGDQDLSQ